MTYIDKEKERATKRAYYASHREQKLTKAQEYYQKNRESICARERVRYKSPRPKRCPLCPSCRRGRSTNPSNVCQLPRHIKAYEYNLRKGQVSRVRIARIVIEHYGGKCSCCGFVDFDFKIHGRRFLQIDHIEGGGNSHRKLVHTGSGQGFYRWLIRNNFPFAFRVLCAGCNVSIKPGEAKCVLHK